MAAYTERGCSRLPLIEAMESIAVIVSYDRGQKIGSPEDPIADWYRVVSEGIRAVA
jgi:hypothetical protein